MLQFDKTFVNQLKNQETILSYYLERIRSSMFGFGVKYLQRKTFNFMYRENALNFKL